MVPVPASCGGSADELLAVPALECLVRLRARWPGQPVAGTPGLVCRSFVPALAGTVGGMTITRGQEVVGDLVQIVGVQMM
jgi:hypothetical protein